MRFGATDMVALQTPVRRPMVGLPYSACLCGDPLPAQCAALLPSTRVPNVP